MSGTQRVRHWITCFSKRVICQCGCKGTHTYSAVFEVINWMLRSCASGIMPAANHLNIPFSTSNQPGDRARAAAAGRHLPFRAFLVRKTCDWQWAKQVCGLTGWKDGPLHRCCWMCGATCRDLGTATMEAPWRATIEATRRAVKIHPPQGCGAGQGSTPRGSRWTGCMLAI